MKKTDFSQNGDRRFEWQDYFAGSHEMHKDFVCMGSIGNNDMVRKVESWAYTYYFNEENLASVDGKEIVNCHAWEIGDCWFCALNSNEDVALQKKWFMEKAAATTKRWKIVYTHDAPYTLTKLMYSGQAPNGVWRNDSKLFHSFARLFEAYGVHLVLCGHKHNYCRSLPVYNTYDVKDTTLNNNRINNEPERGVGDSWGVPVWVHQNTPNPNDPERPYIDLDKGVMYCMSNATGFKLKSNKDIPTSDWYYGHVQEDKLEHFPQYTMWTITPDAIHVDSYQLRNVKFPDPNDNNGRIYKHKFDQYTLAYKNKPYRDMAYVGQIKVSQNQLTIPNGQASTSFKVRLTVSPTHNQVVRFASASNQITFSTSPLTQGQIAAGVTEMINDTLLFTPENYYIERTIIVSKADASSFSTQIVLSSEQHPDVSAVVNNVTLTLQVI